MLDFEGRSGGTKCPIPAEPSCWAYATAAGRKCSSGFPQTWWVRSPSGWTARPRSSAWPSGCTTRASSRASTRRPPRCSWSASATSWAPAGSPSSTWSGTSPSAPPAAACCGGSTSWPNTPGRAPVPRTTDGRAPVGPRGRWYGGASVTTDPVLSTLQRAPNADDSRRSERLLAACARRPTDVTPVWMMRQAGRSLPAYRELRKRYGLVEITRQPELCAEVTLMPVEALGVDAAIMFADIMLPLAGLGVAFELVENVGPVVADPIRSVAQVDALTARPARESVPSVLKAIRILRRELDGVVPLIGFAGA